MKEAHQPFPPLPNLTNAERVDRGRVMLERVRKKPLEQIASWL